MTISVRHAKVVTKPDDPLFDVSKNEWNEEHNISGIAASGANSDITSLDALVGTTTIAPIHLQNGVLKTSPSAGDLEYADGHLYFTSSTRHAIVTSAGVKTSTTTVVNTTIETEIYSYTLSGDELHADHRVTLTADGVYSNASAADDWTMRLKFNGVTVRTLNRIGGNVTDAGWKIDWIGTIRTVGVNGTYIDMALLNDGTNSFSAGTITPGPIDTTIPNTVSVTIQWAAAKPGNTFSCVSGDLTFRH